MELAGDDAISVEGGSADLKGIAIGGWDDSGVGVKATKSARVTVSDLDMDVMATAFEGREGARLTVTKADVRTVGLVALAKKKEMRYGPVVIELNNLDIKEAKAEFECGEGSVIKRDGKEVVAEKAKQGK